MSQPKTCPCGQALDTEDRRFKYCPSCREERYNAAHPLKVCKKCGKESRWAGRTSRLCDTCHAEMWRAAMEKRRQQRKEEYLANLEKRQHEAKKETFIRKVDDASSETQVAALLRLVQLLLACLPEVEVEDTEEVNPEQVPADDQDAIDDAFTTLMEGFDL